MPKQFLLIVIFLFPAWEAVSQSDDWPELVSELDSAIEAVKEAHEDDTQKNAAELLRVMKRIATHPNALENEGGELPITQVSPKDGKFRLFTWNIPQANGKHTYYGIMAAKGRKSNMVVEFRDSTHVLAGDENRELYPGKWYGALYYDIISTKRGGKTYYTLTGWKGHSRTVTKKVIEVIHFSGKRVRLGAALFLMGPEQKKNSFRQVFSYGIQAKMFLRPDPTQDRIIFDHLAPSRPDLQGQHAFYGPDLSYDAFEWDGREWILERDVDVKGNPNESKIWTKPESTDPEKLK